MAPRQLSRFVQALFFGEVYKQCKFALQAAGDLADATDALASISGPYEIEPSVDDVWYAIQNLMVAAGNISKLLWGDYHDEAIERQPLRRIIAVRASSPLKKRALRNHSEHIDARIMAVYGQSRSPPGAFVDRNIGPPGMIAGKRGAPRFHHYDPHTGLLTFWKDSVSIPAVLAEVERILPIAQDEELILQ